MALWDAVKQALALQPVFESTRAIDSFVDAPDLETQLLRVQGLTPRPWRPASLTEALGVPAIFGAVNLIANTVGSLTMRALRNEVELPPDDRPRVIVRPDPFRIPRDFYRQTAYNIASRGEGWLWTAARDIDGNALSVLSLPPQEITVTENPRDLRYPIIQWRNKVIPNADIKQIVYAQEPGSLRGVGPLQMCQAAISVAVEAQEWAANFYAEGGNPSIVVQSKVQLTEDEAKALKAQWINSDNNTPKIVDDQIEDVKAIGQDTEGAQMLTAREYQNGDVARMFGIPGTLLDYAVSGSSITYQNVGQEFDNFLRRCLAPNYLIPIEQTMSDLLPRSTVARFDVDRLVMADIKTRYDVYNVGIPIGVITADEARQFEGRLPGDTDNAAVPFSQPQAVPSSLPIQQMRTELGELRCSGCRRKLLEVAGPGTVVRCPRCKAVNTVPGAQTRTEPVDDERRFRAFGDSLGAAIAREMPQPQPQMPPDVRVDAPVHIHEGAVQVKVEPANVTVEPTQITLEQPDLADVVARALEGQQSVAARAMDTLDRTADRPIELHAHVETPDVHVDSPVHIAEGAIQSPVTVNVPEQEPPKVTVKVPEPRRTRRQIVREGKVTAELVEEDI